MKRNLATRLTVRVGVPAALLFALLNGIAGQRSYNRLLKETEHSSRLMARQEAGKIETELSRATKIPEMIALAVESGGLDTEAKLEAYLHDALERNPEVYGSALSFEANSFTPGKKWYAPYYYWKEGKPEFVQLGNPEYDYFKWEWYAAPKASGRARWSEPYFDEGGGDAIMTTYSVPIRRAGAFWGIATIDIAMSQLIERTAKIKVGQSGYAFIVSKQGRFLAFPDKARVMRAMIQELNPELGSQMVAGEDGFLRTQGPLSGKQAWISFVPVLGGEFSLAIVHPESELMAEAFSLQGELAVVGIVGLVVMFIGLTFIARSISRPIQNLALAAQEVAAGRLDYQLTANASIDEVDHLNAAFHKMTRDLQMRMEELRYTTTITQRLQGELSGARAIQMSLLPKTFPAFPNRAEIDIHAVIRPAREVGGDFYDFYFIDETHLCLAIGDVSGKGIPAALFMAVTRTLLKATSSSVRCPGETVALVNQQICEQAAGGMFVTLIFALIDTTTGKLTLCNAGHLPPLIVTAEGEVDLIRGETGMALGLLADAEYPMVQRQLAPGDTLVFVTDGITEALDGERNFYSSDRLTKAVEGVQLLPIQGVTRKLVQEVQVFSGDREQTDDIAVLAFRWLPPEKSI